MTDTNSKKHTTSRNYPKRKRNKTGNPNENDLNSMPNELRCPCGGGQSCIIDRRWVGDWIHEDDVFKRNGLPLRTTCFDVYTYEQEQALSGRMNRRSTRSNTNSTNNTMSNSSNHFCVFDGGENEQQSIRSRWEEDANSDRL
tara:strand:+ start:204 stop:629 length:426 start_codon:yes stop_codon:yes gene_type:complete